MKNEEKYIFKKEFEAGNTKLISELSFIGAIIRRKELDANPSGFVSLVFERV